MPRWRGAEPAFKASATIIKMAARSIFDGVISQGNGIEALCISGRNGSILEKAWPDGLSKPPWRLTRHATHVKECYRVAVSNCSRRAGIWTGRQEDQYFR